MGFGISGLLPGFCGLEFETGVWDSRSWIEGLVFGVKYSGSGILGPGFWVWDSGSGPHDLGPRDLGPHNSGPHDSGF